MKTVFLAGLSMLVLAAGALTCRAEDSFTLMMAADIHYLSPSLTDQGEYFKSVVESGDGKLPERSAGLVQELVDAAFELKPDALILAGDLTYNGERQSLLELIELLIPLQDKGIPVLVIPGNHDINYPYACRYEGNSTVRTDNISQAAFAAACGRFGYNDAISACESSFSYVYEVGKSLRLLFLDANTEARPGGLDEQTLTWAEEQLESAREQDIQVISFTHQNVLRQSPLFYMGFVISNEEEAAELLRNGGVRHNYSGHSHICHTTTENGLTDHAAGSMTVSPLPYTVITVTGDGCVDTAVRYLPSFALEARERFEICTSRQIRETLREIAIPDEDREEMIRFAVDVNARYFAGILDDSIRKEAGWSLWETYGQTTFWY